MSNLVIALSGGIGAGKADLGKALSTALDADRASFGAEVRRRAGEMGLDADDVGILQQVGQSLVLTQADELVRRVLAQRVRPHVPLVVEGVRHVEILVHMRKQIGAASVRLLHVETPSAVRVARLMARDGIERRIVARYQADVNEEQAARILPQYADAIVNGDLPLPLQVARVTTFLGLAGLYAVA